jgi:sigma-54 specific flagellar transcriptional regulator A
MQQVFEIVEQVAPSRATVLITGDSGTGKELVANALHQRSTRASGPFVKLHCAALAESLLESELFGHEKGSFTGAMTRKDGRFQIADGGTLFLDEIGDMSLPMQVKLLRVLQERAFERVGSALQYRCNVRIIAATHRDLEAAITNGGFREDLFYRLNVFPIEMPALRTRTGDLPILMQNFSDLNVAAGRGPVAFSAAAMDCLTRYRWPGNVRELGNLMERLSILCAGRLVTTADLPPRYLPRDFTPPNEVERIPAVLPDPVPAATLAATPALLEGESGEGTSLAEREVLFMLEPTAAGSGIVLPPCGIDLRAHVSAIEESLVRQALERGNGVVAQAARLLGLRRTTLVEKLRKFDIGGLDEATAG